MELRNPSISVEDMAKTLDMYSPSFTSCSKMISDLGHTGSNDAILSVVPCVALGQRVRAGGCHQGECSSSTYTGSCPAALCKGSSSTSVIHALVCLKGTKLRPRINHCRI